MITRQDLNQLKSLTGVPALSILLPTHRTSPDNKQDPIRVKNLVDEATDRLSIEFSSRELDNATGAQKVVSTIGEAWRLAQEGRGKLLLVEKNYHVLAIVTENGGLKLVEQSDSTEVMDDAVDEIIEAVLAKGGSVAIMDDGALSIHQRIALILRY